MTGNERRRYPRKGSEIPVEYSLSVLEFRELKKVRGRGIATDISDKGMGLITDYPLEPGHVLVLSNSDRNLFPKIAIVRWVSKLSDSYRIGLEFV